LRIALIADFRLRIEIHIPQFHQSAIRNPQSAIDMAAVDCSFAGCPETASQGSCIDLLDCGLAIADFGFEIRNPKSTIRNAFARARSMRSSDWLLVPVG
jgi:hypothetical protein